ncbi:hypothetical protein K2X85_01595 [bacterium]|nr:hypothetical protein [bacterium]
MTKTSWESSLADFYRDDWERLKDDARRLNELITRWKGEKPPQVGAKEFTENLAGLEQATQRFQQGIDSKNVEMVTEGLREIGKRVTAFEVTR